jgi:hypothetical protein
MDHSPLKFFARSAGIARVYDIIGDIHGHATMLERLLLRMGYRNEGGRWGYPDGERIAVFVGDYIDRGPEIPEAVGIVRSMADAGTALPIMGNHEFNAIGWHTTGPDSRPLRSHNQSHFRQHRETLRAYADVPGELESDLRWMRSLPLFLETPDIRVVHATWDTPLVQRVRDACGAASPAPLEDDEFLYRSFDSATPESEVVDVLLKGREIPLPQDASYRDKDGTHRHTTRIRWWLPEAELKKVSNRDGTLPLKVLAMPPADTLAGSVHLDRPGLDAGTAAGPPVFFGHYWLTGAPRPLGRRAACLDYSVARGGPLCAYRYDGKLPLRADRFVCIYPDEA